MKNKKRNITLMSIGIIILIGIVVRVSYGYIRYSESQKEINNIKTDCLKIEFTEQGKAINLQKAYPLTDEEGKSLDPYEFTIKNTCTTSVTYDVNLEIINTEAMLAEKYIAIQFGEEEKDILKNLPDSDIEYKDEKGNKEKAKRLKKGILNLNESVTYTLRLWLDEDVTVEDTEAMNKDFESKVRVEASINQYAEKYTEDILHGADPVLGENMIPVTIDEKGNVTKANENDKWYEYANKKWANAVILTSDGEVGDAGRIEEEAIESYFVWIPKYSYKLFDLGEYNNLTQIEENKEQPISIKFGTKNTDDANKDECTTPMNDDQGISGGKGNCQVGDYMTHPAFISMGTNGLWVGKFESGYKGADSTTADQHNENDHTKLQIKPNVYSWRNIQVANAYQTSFDYNRDLDSHMMKNTEWGSVAYLSHSIYGTCTGSECEEIRINNNSDYKTGYAGINKPTTGFTDTNESCTEHAEACNEYGNSTSGLNEAWNTSTGVLASTTQNITGIYDMSGGTAEYLMGVVSDESEKPIIKDSGFSLEESTSSEIKFPTEKKYYDLYNYNNASLHFNGRILGDATGEFGPFANAEYQGTTQNATKQSRRIGSWYSDVSVFAYDSWPWFRRGGKFLEGLDSGIFNFHEHDGNTQLSLGFRTVLAVKN